MNILEIYESVHGELPNIGRPCTIVRLAGCNLDCEYCDAPTWDAKEMTVEDVLSKAKSLGNQHMLITGGEPLEQSEVVQLVYPLAEEGYHITLETNGTIPLNRYPVLGACESIVMDVKLFRETQSVEVHNLEYLGKDDAIKFVYEGEADLEKARIFICSFQTQIKTMVVFSPLNVKQPLLPRILEMSKSFPQLDIRLQCQIHKVLGLG